MSNHVATFQSRDAVYHADTCEPLKWAAHQGHVRLEALSHGAYPGEPLPSGTLEEVRSVGFWDAPTRQDWGLGRHCNEGIELTFVARGSVAFGVDDASFLLHRGNLTITRPWQTHWVGNPHIGACKLIWLILDVEVRKPHQTWQWPSWFVLSQDNLQRLTQLLHHNEQPVWNTSPAIAHAFENLARALETRDASTQLSRIKLHINELFLILLEMFEEQEIPLDASLSSTTRSVDLFLNKLPELLHYPWTVEDMAAECGLGRSQFSDYCKRLTNMTPLEYLTHRRLEAARDMLVRHPEMRVTEISNACGFGSSQYFATVFKGKLGCTPNEYRS